VGPPFVTRETIADGFVIDHQQNRIFAPGENGVLSFDLKSGKQAAEVISTKDDDSVLVGGNITLANSHDGVAYWDLRELAPSGHLIPNSRSKSHTLTRDGKYALLWSSDLVSVWPIGNNAPTLSEASKEDIVAADITPTGDWVGWCTDNKVELRQLSSSSEKVSFPLGENIDTPWHFHVGQQGGVVIDENGSVSLYTPETNIPNAVSASTKRPNESAISHDGRLVGVALDSGVASFDVARAVEIKKINISVVTSQFYVTRNGRTLIATGDEEVTAWNTDGLTLIGSPISLDTYIDDLRVAEDGTFAIAIKGGKILRIDFGKSQSAKRLRSAISNIRDVQLLPGDHQLLAIDDLNVVRLIDAKTGAPVQGFSPFKIDHDANIFPSPDGLSILVAGDSGVKRSASTGRIADDFAAILIVA